MGEHRVRSRRQAERWKKELNRYRHFQRFIRENAPDILASRNFHKNKQFIQHGNITVSDHVLSVARCSLALTDMFHISCKRCKSNKNITKTAYSFYLKKIFLLDIILIG